MKRLFIASLAFLTMACFGANVYGQNQELSKKEAKEQKKEQKKAKKEMQKKIDNFGETVAFEKAAACLKNGNFVIEADQIQSPRGGYTSVSSNTNFISMANGESVIQVAPSNHIAGPNGVGGITVEGSVSNIKINESKSGNITYSYNVQGVGVSASVKIVLPKGGTKATATIYPNFSSNDVTLSGRVVAPQNSKVFKGRSL